MRRTVVWAAVPFRRRWSSAPPGTAGGDKLVSTETNLQKVEKKTEKTKCEALEEERGCIYRHEYSPSQGRRGDSQKEAITDLFIRPAL